MRSTAWQRILEEFMAAQAARGLAQGTLKHRRYYVGEFADHAPADPWSLTAADVDRFTSGDRWTQQSGRIMRQALRAFLGWAYACGHLGTDLSPPREGKAVMFSAPWHRAITEYLTDCSARGLSPLTIRWRRRCLQSLAARLPEDPWTVTTAHLRDEMAAHPEWLPESRKTVRTTLRSFYAWATEEGYVEVSPADRLKPIRIPATVPRPAQEETLAAALEAADPRVQLMIALAAYAGLRASEVAKVNVRDVDGDVLRMTGKGGVTREIPLVPGLHQALREAGDHAGWVFPNGKGTHISGGHVSRLVSSALPDGVTCHMLRHRFASSAFAGSRDLLTVSKLLGHSRPETTQRYTRLPDDALRGVVSHVGDFNVQDLVSALGRLPDGWAWDPAEHELTADDHERDGCVDGCCETLTAPCPPWCADGAGHPYDHLSRWTRIHTKGYGHGVVVEAQYEAVAHDGPEVLDRGQVAYYAATEGLEPTEARGLASALLAATADLERLGLDVLPDAG